MTCAQKSKHQNININLSIARHFPYCKIICNYKILIVLSKCTNKDYFFRILSISHHSPVTTNLDLMSLLQSSEILRGNWAFTFHFFMFQFHFSGGSSVNITVSLLKTNVFFNPFQISLGFVHFLYQI
jgi:hypothetical protein